jgi:Tol biopolymer transport system component
MTPDGQRVAHSVQINNAATATFYVWDAPSGKSIYTNVASTSIYKTAISPDGNRVVCYQTNQVVLADLDAKTQFNFSNALSRAGCQFSADSQSLAFVAGTNQIYLYNFPAASNVLVSAGANGICDSPALSADGRFVAYRSFASNLAANDTNGVPDILLYDSLAGTTTLVTASPFGNWPANGRSLNPVFSSDGQTLVWQSWANNLAGQDFNQWCNLYALQSFAANSAGVGQPFSISAFGLSSLASFGSSASTSALTWPAGPDVTYQVQFTDNLDNPQWQILTNAIRIIGTQGYMMDTDINNSQRFYRVVSF